MNLKQITSIYFSPTGSTKRVVELIAGQVAGRAGGRRESLDLTDAAMGRPDYRFIENEAVAVGVPVYGGRVPATAAERFKKLHGRGTPAILVVTYGNRAYEDALLELGDILKAQGFVPVAAAAVAAEHNIVRSIAEGRPDGKDEGFLRRFGVQAGEKLAGMQAGFRRTELPLKGNRPYREYHGVPLKIKTGPSCINCGACIRGCPVQAISRTDARITDGERCIRCMRCIQVCKAGARKINPLVLMAVRQKLKKVCADRKEPEFIL